MERLSTDYYAYGYTPLIPFHTDPRYREVFEEKVSRWVKVGTRSVCPTEKDIRHMTLECALVFAKWGIKGAHAVENLKYLSTAIVSVLKMMGHGVTCDSSRSIQQYLCCDRWSEIARADGMEEKQIAFMERYCARYGISCSDE